MALDLDRGDHGATSEQLVFKATDGANVHQTVDPHLSLVVTVNDGTPTHNVLGAVIVLGVDHMLSRTQAIPAGDLILA